MLERKLYKTKLCVLYKRGHCARQTCSFAHGDAELRRFSGSFNGRRDYRGNDLRDKLERRHSPQRRYSPERDARGRRTFHGHKQGPYDSGHGRSRSPGKKRSNRKMLHLDGQSDASGSLKISDGDEEHAKERKHTSYGSKDVLEEQLKQLHLDIEMLDDHKSQLEIYLEERVQEANTLASRIEELETRLSIEQEDCERITSQIKKFIKAHSRYSRAQEEFKRSQARLQRLGDQLCSGASRSGANEDDSSINILSDGEPNGNDVTSPMNDLQNRASPLKKRARSNLGGSEEAKRANSRKREVEKRTQWDGPTTDNHHKHAESAKKTQIGNNGHMPLGNENNHKRGKNASLSNASVDKVKGSEYGHMLPSTGLAAHAVDEFIEVIEMEDKIGSLKAGPIAFEIGNTDEKALLPYPPLPPPPPLKAPQHVYSQYKGEDEDVEIGDADINTEVDIDQL